MEEELVKETELEENVLCNEEEVELEENMFNEDDDENVEETENMNENENILQDKTSEDPRSTNQTSKETSGINKESDKTNSEPLRLTKLPLSRIRNLMKLDPDLQISSSEAVFVICKATELFIDSLAKEAFMHTAQGKKKILQKKDVDAAVESVDSLMFLDGAMNF